MGGSKEPPIFMYLNNMYLNNRTPQLIEQTIKPYPNKSRDPVHIKCKICNKVQTIKFASNFVLKNKSKQQYICILCVQKTPEYKNKISQKAKKSWQNEDYRELKIKQSQSLSNNKEFINLQIELGKKRWENPLYVSKCLNTMRSDKYKIGLSNRSIELWKNDDYRKKVAKGVSKSPPTSILDSTILNTLKKLRFDASTIALGPWTFDACIKIKDKKDLLIECQGDYWHNKKEIQIKDKQKRTYYERYLSDKYELIELWEHDFYCIGKIYNIINKYLDIKFDEIDLSKLKFKKIDNVTAKDFINSFHYMRKSRHGLNLGLINNDIIILCTFSSITRKESAKRLECEYNEVLELTRLVSNPKYKCINSGSKLLSNAVKYIKLNFPKIKYLITFADTTLGHTGAIYKASNWKFDGEVKPTYWYIDKEGNYRHKKTIWDQAKRLGMTENNYVEYCKLIKIKGEKLLRFIYKVK